jgi:hypothetical protein
MAGTTAQWLCTGLLLVQYFLTAPLLDPTEPFPDINDELLPPFRCSTPWRVSREVRGPPPDHLSMSSRSADQPGERPSLAVAIATNDDSGRMSIFTINKSGNLLINWENWLPLRLIGCH